jgi:hypothetical protein
MVLSGPIGERDRRHPCAHKKNPGPTESGNLLLKEKEGRKRGEDIANGGQRNDIGDIGNRQKLHENTEMEGLKGSADKNLRGCEDRKEEGKGSQGVARK